MPDSVTEIRPHPQALIIVVKKRALDAPTTDSLMDDVLSAAAQTPGVPVVLDMTQVRFAPSVALGALVQMTKSFKLDGRRLVLIGVEPNVLGSMRVTNLHTLLEIYHSIDQVVKPASKG